MGKFLPAGALPGATTPNMDDVAKVVTGLTSIFRNNGSQPISLPEFDTIMKVLPQFDLSALGDVGKALNQTYAPAVSQGLEPLKGLYDYFKNPMAYIDQPLFNITGAPTLKQVFTAVATNGTAAPGLTLVKTPTQTMMDPTIQSILDKLVPIKVKQGMSQAAQTSTENIPKGIYGNTVGNDATTVSRSADPAGSAYGPIGA